MQKQQTCVEIHYIGPEQHATMKESFELAHLAI